MVKKRPAIVISPRLRKRNDLCTVVPLSTTEPLPPLDHHCRLEGLGLPPPYDAVAHWVKADMIATVGFHRLCLPFDGRHPSGKRKYVIRVLSPPDLARVRACVLHALGLGSLTTHLG